MLRRFRAASERRLLMDVQTVVALCAIFAVVVSIINVSR